MKLDLQTLATVFASRLGDNNRRIMSAPAQGCFAYFELDGVSLRVGMNTPLVASFKITDEEDVKYTRAELASLYADPIIESIKSQFESVAKEIVVSSQLPLRGADQEAVATSNGVSVRVMGLRTEDATEYTFEVLLGTFSI